MEKRPDLEPEHRLRRHHGRHGGRDRGDFFGLDVEKMSPRAQVVTGLAVLIPAVVAGVAMLTLFPNFWWLIFVFGWSIFPAFGLLIRGIAGLSEEGRELPVSNDKERELLEALREHGELTPARAAMETSLTVAEADNMLKELAEGGHLDVRVRRGAFLRLVGAGDRRAGARGLVVMRGCVRGIIPVPGRWAGHGLGVAGA